MIGEEVDGNDEEGDDVEEVDYDGTRATAHEYLDMGDGEHVDRCAHVCKYTPWGRARMF